MKKKIKLPNFLRFKRKRQEKKFLAQVGAALVHELRHDRRMRRKLKGTALEKRLDNAFNSKDW